MNKRTLGVNYTRFQCYEQRRPLRHAMYPGLYENRAAMSRLIDMQIFYSYLR